MAVTYGPKIGTNDVPDGFADGDTYTPPMDRFLRMIQALAQLNAISYAVTAPPGGPADGDTYLVPAGATGAWTGKDQSVAYWTLHDLANPGGVWEFYAPLEGWWAFNNADGNFYKFNGTIWVAVTFAATGFQAKPAWWMSGDGSNYSFTTAPGQFSTGTANLVQFWMIRVPYTIKIKTATFRYIGAGSGGVGGMAIYDSTGQTKLVSFDNFAFSGGAGPKVITNTGGGEVTLPPGLYIVACAQSTTGASATTQGGFLTQGTSDDTNSWNANGTVRSGVAANAMVAGVLPAALGVLSISAAAPAASIPSVCFEPAT